MGKGQWRCKQWDYAWSGRLVDESDHMYNQCCKCGIRRPVSSTNQQSANQQRRISEYRSATEDRRSDVAKSGGTGWRRGIPLSTAFQSTYSFASSTNTGASASSVVPALIPPWAWLNPPEDISDLPIETATEPFRAWKQASVYDNDSGVFCGVIVPVCYRAEDEAICYYVPSVINRHVIETCSCGFYAMRDRLDPTSNFALLEVELYGRVVVAEHGYRATHQRVLRAEMPYNFMPKLSEAELSGLYGTECVRRPAPTPPTTPTTSHSQIVATYAGQQFTFDIKRDV